MEIEKNASQSPEASIGQTSQTLCVPRWIIYFQGALLGVVATTFFIFGLMVGSLPQPRSAALVQGECQVRGRVVYVGEAGERGDKGAVVILLPVQSPPANRLEGQDLKPESFKPLNNSAIDFIHGAGGAVVRADSRGQFEVYVDVPATYALLVISSHQVRPSEAFLSKAEMAKISRFFSPVESLLGDQDYFFEVRSFEKKEMDLGIIEF